VILLWDIHGQEIDLKMKHVDCKTMTIVIQHDYRLPNNQRFQDTSELSLSKELFIFSHTPTWFGISDDMTTALVIPDNYQCHPEIEEDNSELPVQINRGIVYTFTSICAVSCSVCN